MKKSIFNFIILFLGVLNSEKQLVEPIMGICWFEMVGYLVYTILWTINRNHHRNIQILVHKIIYTVLIAELILSAFNSISYTIMLKYPKSQIFRYLTPTISFLMNVAILLLSILLVSGLSVVFDSLSICQYTIIICSTLIFGIALFVLECLSKIEYNMIYFIVLLIIFVIGYIFYFLSILYLSQIAIKALVIHLDMINQRGINPNTTPSYKKIRMLRFTRNSSVALFFIMVISYVLFYADVAPYYVIYAIKAIAMLILVGIICYKCRIRQAMSSTYGDDEEAYIVNDDNNDINSKINPDLPYKMQKQNKEPYENKKNGLKNISRETKSSSEDDDDENDENHKLNNICDHENETNENEETNKKDEKKNWSSDVVLPHIPQIHNLSNKIYSKDPDE